MIKNERQYRVTKAQAGRFRQALIELKSSNRAPSLLRKAQTEAITSQLEQLEEQIADYEQLKSGKHRELAYETFSEMLHGLTKARIARGLTQKALAHDNPTPKALSTTFMPGLSTPERTASDKQIPTVEPPELPRS